MVNMNTKVISRLYVSCTLHGDMRILQLVLLAV